MKFNLQFDSGLRKVKSIFKSKLPIKINEELKATREKNWITLGREDHLSGKPTLQASYYRIKEINEELQASWTDPNGWWNPYRNRTVNPSGSVNLAQPTNFYEQLMTSRVMYGEPITRRDDEVLSTITTYMDFKVHAAVGYGCMIIPKMVMGPGMGIQAQLNALHCLKEIFNKDYTGEQIQKVEKELMAQSQSVMKPTEWEDAMKLKKVFDWWTRNINDERFFKNGQLDGPVIDIDSGFNGVRYQLHRQIYEGLVVMRYTRDEVKTPYGLYNLPTTISFIDPMMIEPYDLKTGELLMDKFFMNYEQSISFGQVGWKYKQEYANGMKLVNDKNVRYLVRKMFCRQGQLMPVPFLIRKDVFAIALIIRMMKNMDYALSRGTVDYFFLITLDGKELKELGFDKMDIQDWMTETSAKFKQRLSNTMAYVGLPGTKAEMIQPDLAALINQGKYAPFYRMLLDAMDMPSIDVDDTGRMKSVLNPKVFLAAMEWLGLWEKELWEHCIFENEILGQNPVLMKLANGEVPNLWLCPKTIFETQATTRTRESLFKAGYSDYGSMARSIGMDPDAVTSMRKIENESGLADIMLPIQTFTQGVNKK